MPLRPRNLVFWRIAFLAYAAALTVGTHWPRLELPREVPNSDKIVHVAAFCGLTILLWQSRWIASLRGLAIIAPIWAIIDEITQAIPGLHRTVSAYDAAANLLGIAIALAIVATVRHIQLRHRAGEHVTPL